VFFVPGGLARIGDVRKPKTLQRLQEAMEQVNIKWEEWGDGTPLLLIQGLGYARWSWDPVVPGLAERYRVISFDNRGIGESDKPDGPYTARQMADDALQVLDEAGVGRAHVLGASLGGMIAQEVAATAPERVEKLVLCCTTAGGPAAVPMPEVSGAAVRRGGNARARGGAATLRRERTRPGAAAGPCRRALPDDLATSGRPRSTTAPSPGPGHRTTPRHNA